MWRETVVSTWTKDSSLYTANTDNVHGILLIISKPRVKDHNQAEEHLKYFNLLRFGHKNDQQNSSLQFSDIWF